MRSNYLRNFFRSTLSLLFIFGIESVVGQCPNASFTLPASVCAGSAITLSNTSSNSSSYFWDFTPGFFRSSGTKIIDSISSLQNPRDITVLEQNDTTVAFYLGGSSGKMYRAVFANGIDQPATAIDDLGDLGLLYQPSDVDFYKENNEWYGLIVDYGNFGLVRFHLGNSLLNSPDNASVLLTFANSNLSNPWSIKINKDSIGNITALATSTTTNSFTIFDFGNSILNSPFANPPVVIPGLAYVMDGIIVKECGNYYGLFAGYSSSNIIMANFGSSVNSSPTFSTLISNGNPSDLAIVQDSSSWKLLTTNWSSGEIRKYDLGNSLSSNSANLIGTENFGGTNPKGIEVIRKGNTNYVFLQNNGTSNFQIVKYSNIINVSQASSTDFNPTGISFNSSGIFPVTLTSTDSSGNTSSVTQQLQVFNSPISEFSVSNLCEGDSTNFVDSSFISNGVIISWLWNFGDGNTSNLQNPLHLYFSPGTYTVTLQTSSGSCDNIKSKLITISPKPVANFITSTSCSNKEISFTDLSTITTGSIVQWNWSFGNGDTSSTQNPNYAFPTGGNYLVSLIVTTNNLCSSSFSTNQIINSSPIANYSSINTCIGQQTDFLNQTLANGSAITNYDWNFGDGFTDTSSSPSHTFPNVLANYQVELIVSATNGCNDTISQNIRISNIPTASFSTPAFPCQSNQVHFDDLSTVSGDTVNGWLWDFGDGSIDSIASPNHIYTTPGTYTVSLNVFSPTSCPSTQSQQTITVIESPIALFSYSSTCLGTTTSFINMSTPASGNIISSYSWHFTQTDSSNFQNPFFNFNGLGSYVVSLVATSPEGCIGQAQMNIDVHPQPIVSFTTNLACSRQALQFINQTSIDSLSTVSQYLWNFGDFSNPATNTSSLSDPIHTYDTTSFYNASLIAITNYGCSDTLVKSIRVNQSAPVNFTYSPTCLGNLMEFFNPGSSLDSLYNWNFGDGQTNQLREPAHYYAIARNYQVVLSVTTSQGCVSSASKQVSVSPIPVANFSTPEGCKNAPYSLTELSTVSTGSIVSYQWNITEGNIILFGNNPSYTFSDTGLYHVSLQVTSDIGCKKTISKTFNIHSLPTSNFSFDPQFGNPPLDVQFTDQSSQASSYNWNFGIDSTISSLQNPHYLYTDTGLFTITHVISSIYGCKDTARKNIYVIKPILDIAVTGDSSYILGDYFYIVTTISNLGTQEINSVLMQARLADGNTIREKLERSIPNGTTGIQTYHFTAAFHLSEGINYDYYCISATQPNGQSDDVPTNNEKCYSLIQDLSIQNPYPNPVVDQFGLRIVAPFKAKISLVLYDQSGKSVNEIAQSQIQQGLSEYNVDTKNLEDGIYTIQIIFKEKVYYRQIVVTHTSK